LSLINSSALKKLSFLLDKVHWKLQADVLEMMVLHVENIVMWANLHL